MPETIPKQEVVCWLLDAFFILAPPLFFRWQLLQAIHIYSSSHINWPPASQSSNHFCPYSEKEPAPQHGSPLLPQGTLWGYFHPLLLGYSHSFGGQWELQGPSWRCCESWHVVSARKLVAQSMVANGYVAIWFSAVVLDSRAVALCPCR